jgi:Glycosyl hydrolase family 12
MLSVACAAAGVAACGQSRQPHRPITLLPNSSAKGQSYEWNATCQFTPVAAAGCAQEGPILGAAQLAGNEWNLGTHAGTQSVSVTASSAGALQVSGNLAGAPPCTASTCLTRQGNTWVRGFPSVLYGTDQCHADTSPSPSAEFQLPARVDSIPADLVGRTTYNAQGAKVTYDVAYDLWLSPSATKTPCQSDGTVEVMIWTGYDAQALLPAALKLGTTTIPFSVNGTFNGGTDAWSVYATNIYGNGHTVSWGGTVWLVLNTPHATQQGTVTVDISAALADVAALLQRNYGWTSFESTYWLDTIAFGMEYGPQDAQPYSSGPAQFSLNVSKYCLQVGTTAAATTC